ncbi:hypothetical protein ACH5RR_017140 [Cinchona calisaya]|uniref:C2H2-type domain-containing protein n=1 Tax=Cinchona calisaya TaxID=153742 RepID=A0ABD3A023_9GENT
MAANYNWGNYPVIDDQEGKEDYEEQEDQQLNAGEQNQEENADAVWNPYNLQGENNVQFGGEQENVVEEDFVDVGWFPNNLPDNQQQQQQKEEDGDDDNNEGEDVIERDTNGFCNLCKRTFDAEPDVVNHQSQAHRNARIICPNCPRKFECRGEMRKHAGDRHNRNIL